MEFNPTHTWDWKMQYSGYKDHWIKYVPNNNEAVEIHPSNEPGCVCIYHPNWDGNDDDPLVPKRCRNHTWNVRKNQVRPILMEPIKLRTISVKASKHDEVLL